RDSGAHSTAWLPGRPSRPPWSPRPRSLSTRTTLGMASAGVRLRNLALTGPRPDVWYPRAPGGARAAHAALGAGRLPLRLRVRARAEPGGSRSGAGRHAGGDPRLPARHAGVERGAGAAAHRPDPRLRVRPLSERQVGALRGLPALFGRRATAVPRQLDRGD